MRGFFFDIPKELEQSAWIDGCSKFGAFARIVMPAALPGVVATIIFSFLVTYNDLIFALILTGTRAKTIPVAISKYGQELVQYWSYSAAGVTAAIAPVIILMIFLQKPLLRGFTGGVAK
jgi:multiple sugar transport system permease protein